MSGKGKMDDEIFQESPRRKAQWLEEMKVKLPVGCRVRVLTSDLSQYVDATGTVADYNLGINGEWPMVGVVFDAPIDGTARDGFYDDELQREDH